MLLTYLKLYKNGIISIVLFSLLVAYSCFLWRTSSKVTDNAYLRKEASIQKQVDDIKKSNDALAVVLGTVIDQKLSKLTITNTYITKEVQSEIDKNPIYTDCRNTPTVMQDITNTYTAAKTAASDK